MSCANSDNSTRAQPAIDSSGRTLPPPQLVLVPPPARKRRKLWLIALVSLTCAGFLSAAVYFSAQRDATPACFLITFLLSTAAVTAFLVFLQRFERGRRAKFLRAHRQAVRDPISQAMQRVWKPGGSPSIRRVKRELARLGIEEPDTTLVISFGASPACEIGEHRFEPVVKRRTVVGWFGVIMCVEFGVLLAPMIYLATLGPPANLRPTAIGSFVLIGGLFALSFFATIWEFLCPTFSRIAPRYIDFTRFAFRSRPASIARFPLQAGARVFVVQHAYAWIRLEADGRAKSVGLRSLGRGREVNEIVWKCLLSTAASPPLSDEELSG